MSIRVLFGSFIVLFVALASQATVAQERPTPYELNRELLGFYTSYAERVAETVDGIQADIDDPERRYAWQATKLYMASAVFDVVTSDDPASQLMDLLVMLRLQTRVWGEGGQEFATAEEAVEMHEVLVYLEGVLGSIAAQVVPADLIVEIRAFADNWANENADRRYRAFTRLQDLPDSDAKDFLNERARRGFLLRRIDDANREIEATRFSVERGLFLAKHMPTLVQWHSNLFLLKSVSTPELQQVLGNLDEAISIADRVATSLEKLPQDLSMAIGDNGDALVAITENLRVLSDNVRVIVEVAGPVYKQHMDRGRPPMDLAVVDSIVEQIALSAQELARATETLSEMGYNTGVVEHATTQLATTVEEVAEMMDSRIAEVDARIERQMQHLFYLLVALLVIHLFGRILVFYLERRGRSRH